MALARTSPPFIEAAPATTEKTPRLVAVAWGLLILNTLGSTGAVTVVPMPRSVIQLVTMGALAVAFSLALVVNIQLRIRPSAYLLLLSLLVVVSILSSAHLESGFGALFRCARLAMFVATLWLLTRWWNGSINFVRFHIKGYSVVLLTVAVGLLIAPGKAMPGIYGGRLAGAVWPLTPPQIGQYAAVISGLVLLLWLGKRVDRRSALIILIPAAGLLLLTHTRTATLGLIIGLLVALLSLWLTSSRARGMFTGFGLVAAFGAIALGSLLQAWFLRGQSQDDFSTLTGRAKVWDALLYAPRSVSENLFGVGLGDKSYAGLPIDNSWLAVFHEQGFVGCALVAAFLLVLLAVGVLKPPSLERACALFLIVYCISASYTEAGLGDASPYLLHLAVAGSLLAPRNTLENA